MKRILRMKGNQTRSRRIRIKKKSENNNDCTVMSAYLNTPATNLSASPNHLSMSEPALIFMNVAPHSNDDVKDKEKRGEKKSKIRSILKTRKIK